MAVATYAEFRHDFVKFRCFRLYSDGSGLFSVQQVTGSIDGVPRDVRSWLTGERKSAFARNIANSYGRETWRYNLSKTETGKLLRNWRKRCMDVGQTEVIEIRG